MVVRVAASAPNCKWLKSPISTTYMALFSQLQRIREEETPTPLPLRYILAVSSANHGVLRLVKAIVGALTLKQFLMRAMLHNLTMVNVENLVRLLNRGKPVRDNKAGASDQQSLETRLQRLFRTRINI